MMIPKDYQVAMATEGFPILAKYGLVYLAAQERVGKTLTAILIAERCGLSVKNVVVLTKRKAVSGWEETLAAFKHKKAYTVLTYQTLHKLTVKPDLIILDEAHAYLTAAPKPSKTQKAVRALAVGLPLIYISATPHAQGYHQLYHQMQISAYTPWGKFKGFYAWFRAYGIPQTIQVHGKTLNVYTKMQEESCKICVEHLFVRRSRQELNFPHEPNDAIHFVPLHKDTKTLYNLLMREKALVADPIEASFVADSSMKLRASLHMLEGGVLKWVTLGGDPKLFHDNVIQSTALQPIDYFVEATTVDEVTSYAFYLELPNDEKIQYIKERWGDTDQLVIFYQYKAERLKLTKAFKQAQILQGTSYAEGVELSHIDTCIVYSMDWSTAKYVQRRARQASFKRNKPIDIHYLLVENGLSQQVYETVSTNKKNFVDSTFNETLL